MGSGKRAAGIGVSMYSSSLSCLLSSASVAFPAVVPHLQRESGPRTGLLILSYWQQNSQTGFLRFLQSFSGGVQMMVPELKPANVDWTK